MKNLIIPVIIGLVCLIGCKSNQESDVLPIQQRQVVQLSQQQVSSQIDDILMQHSEFEWRMASTEIVWNVLVNHDSTLVIGYQPDGFDEVNEKIHEIDLQSQLWTEARTNVIVQIQQVYDQLDMNKIAREQVLNVHETLPYFHIKVSEVEVLDRLRQLTQVRYSEPATYLPAEGFIGSQLRTESKLGCGNDPNFSIPSSDYVTVSPSSKIPWNFYNMNIPSAWSISTGDNVTVAIIDTGISPDQGKLNSQFSSGESTGRYRAKFGTYVSSWWWWASPDGPDDQCGHGTQMSGAATAPRSSGGSSLGVAYDANLVSIRGTGDVVIESGREKNGVSDALVLAGNRSDVKIISMSLGTPFSSGQVADAVRYAHNRDKLIFAAAGTSTSITSFVGVIFPATMNETVAVTGIKDNGYNQCNTCHKGSKVDFVAVMQRGSNNNRTSLTLAESGNQPSNVGGSSVATATTAGIAALVWATNPNQTRDQVLNRLKNASDFYPSRNSNYGYGLIDALEAVQ